MTDFINESDAKRNVTVVAMYSNGASGTSKNSTAISIPGIVFSAHYVLQLAYVYIHTSWEASISTFLYSINICIVFKKFVLHDSLIQVHALVLLGGMEVNAMKVWAIIHFNHTSDCSVWCVNMGLYMKNLKQLYNYICINLRILQSASLHWSSCLHSTLSEWRALLRTRYVHVCWRMEWKCMQWVFANDNCLNTVHSKLGSCKPYLNGLLVRSCLHSLHKDMTNGSTYIQSLDISPTRPSP